jgi:acyl carrier protein
MKTDEIKEEIRAFLSKYIKKTDLEDDMKLFTSRLINSLFAMQLVLYLEKQYKIKVENEDLDIKNFNTINLITEFVERKI